MRQPAATTLIQTASGIIPKENVVSGEQENG